MFDQLIDAAQTLFRDVVGLYKSIFMALTSASLTTIGGLATIGFIVVGAFVFGMVLTNKRVYIPRFWAVVLLLFAVVFSIYMVFLS